tara:strand:+ start:72 stop:581 length:510 start_codon:yes stop_codon:yes gene_type:complete
MKLNIGGKEKKEGWHVLNIQKKDGADFIGDISDLSQFKDDSIEEIYASHVFEHINQKNINKTLLGINRILKKNGKFYIAVPDMDILCKMFIDKTNTPQIKIHALRMIFGGQTDEYDFHYFGYNFDLLSNLLKKSGFKDVKKVQKFSIFDDTSNYAPYGEHISLNLIAIK